LVLLGPGDGYAGRRVERVTPIHILEYQIRRQGVFLLVDFGGRKLWVFGYKEQEEINRVMESLKGRLTEMVNFLTARARAEGETT
jgi:hypothetical protein